MTAAARTLVRLGRVGIEVRARPPVRRRLAFLFSDVAARLLVKVKAVLARREARQLGLERDPFFTSLIVMVPTDLPTPSVVMAFMVTFTDLAAEAGAANASTTAAAV